MTAGFFMILLPECGERVNGGLPEVRLPNFLNSRRQRSRVRREEAARARQLRRASLGLADDLDAPPGAGVPRDDNDVAAANAAAADADVGVVVAPLAGLRNHNGNNDNDISARVRDAALGRQRDANALAALDLRDANRL